MTGTLGAIVLLVLLLAQVVEAGESPRVTVAVTHPSLRPLVEAIGGERVEVLSLVPVGVDPHHYEPPTRELLSLLRDVRVIVTTGPSHLPIEERIKELCELGLYDWVVLDYESYAREGLVLLRNPATGLVNPHGYFLSLRGLKAIAVSLSKVLAAIDPGGVELYSGNLQAYLRYLGKLDRILKEALSAVGAVKVALLKPALQYAASDLDLEVTRVLVPEEGASVDVKDVIEFAKDYGKLYDILVVADLELGEYRELVSELINRGVRVAVVPISTLLGTSPELVPLSLALSLLTPQLKAQEPGRGLETLLYAILATTVLLASVLVVFTLKVGRS